MQKLISKTDRIYVAGHRGMAGSAITRALTRSGYTNILTETRVNLDLADEMSVKRWFAVSRPDVVVLAAAKVGGIQANNQYPADFLLENARIQINVIENAWRSDTRRLLFLGSSCIYPKFSAQPIMEESLLNGALEETNQWYALAKITGIQMCNALRKQYGFDAISLMPTNLYGPGDNYHSTNSHVLPALIRKFHEAKVRGDKEVVCWGTGSPFREFLHVDDLGEACVFCLENWDPTLENAPKDTKGLPLGHLNVGTGSDLSIRNLAELVAEATGFKGNILWDTSKPDGTPRKLLDVTQLSRLGWQARIPLAQGLVSTVSDFKQELKNNNLRG